MDDFNTMSVDEFNVIDEELSSALSDIKKAISLSFIQNGVVIAYDIDGTASAICKAVVSLAVDRREKRKPMQQQGTTERRIDNANN